MTRSRALISLSLAMPLAFGLAPTVQGTLLEGEASWPSGVRLELGAMLPPGCVNLPGSEGQVSTADCLATVGEEFVATFTAQVDPVSSAVGLEVHTDFPLASIRRVDTLGRELDAALRARGSLTARLRLTPSPADLTAPGDFRLIRIRALVLDEGEPMAVERAIRLRVAPEPESGVLGRIEGYVFDDQERDGRWAQAAESGLAGWTVSLRTPSGERIATSDAVGRFLFALDEPGQHVVRVQPVPGWEATLPTSLTVTVPAGGCADRTCAMPLFGFHRWDGMPPAGRVTAELVTGRGCLEFDPGTTYELADVPAVRLRISGVEQATVRLQAELPDAQLATVVDRYSAAGGQWYELLGPPSTKDGIVRLRLSAYMGEVRAAPDASATCSYRVLRPGSPHLRVEPGVLDFGVVAERATVRRQISVQNDGDRPLNVRSLTLQAGVSSVFHFGMPGSVRLTGFVLQPGEARTVPVYVTPLQAGTFADVLRIESDDPDAQVLDIALAVHTCCLKSAIVRTQRGCLETGQQPTYFVGENLPLTYRVDTEGSIDVVASISEKGPSGSERVLLAPRRVPINAHRPLDAGPVGGPEGWRQLTIDAMATIGETVMRSRDICTYHVAVPSHPIQAFVFQDANGDGLQQDGELPLSGWRVALSGAEQALAETGEDGLVTFAVQSAGTYTVTLESRDRWLPTAGAVRRVTVGSGPNQLVPTAVLGVKYRQRATVAAQAGMHLRLQAESLELLWNGDLGEEERTAGEVYIASMVQLSSPKAPRPYVTVRVVGPLADGALPSGRAEPTAGGWQIVPATTPLPALGLVPLDERQVACPVGGDLVVGVLVWEDDSLGATPEILEWLQHELGANGQEGDVVARFDAVLDTLVARLRAAGDQPLGRAVTTIPLPPLCSGGEETSSVSGSEPLVLETLVTEAEWQRAADQATGQPFEAAFGVARPTQIGRLTLHRTATRLAGRRYATVEQPQPAADEIRWLELGQPDEGLLRLAIGLGPALTGAGAPEIAVYLDTDNDWSTGAAGPLADGAEYRIIVRQSPALGATLWRWSPDAASLVTLIRRLVSRLVPTVHRGAFSEPCSSGRWERVGDLGAWALWHGEDELRLDVDLERLGDPARSVGSWAVAERGERIIGALPDQPHDLAPAVPLNRAYAGFPATAKAIEPAPGALDVPCSSQICVQFNKSMNHAMAETSFSLAPAHVGSFAWHGEAMCFVPSERLRPYTEYRAAIADSALDRSGSRLDGDGDGLPGGALTFSFWTGGPPLTTTGRAGEAKRSFLIGEPVFVTGSGLPPGARARVYLVAHQDPRHVSARPLVDLSTNGVETVTTDANGQLGLVLAEPVALRGGEFNVVLDVDGDGRLNLERDFMDGLSVGFSVRGRAQRAFLPALALNHSYPNVR